MSLELPRILEWSLKCREKIRYLNVFLSSIGCLEIFLWILKVWLKGIWLCTQWVSIKGVDAYKQWWQRSEKSNTVKNKKIVYT
jgi:hypothetical protein